MFDDQSWYTAAIPVGLVRTCASGLSCSQSSPCGRDSPVWSGCRSQPITVREAGRPGRPPRARGRGVRTDEPHPGPRKTPACAGTSRCPGSGSTDRPEDPRVRGDESAEAGAGGVSRGRPPRARGREQLARRSGDRQGKTPACAGTSEAYGIPKQHIGEDPRVRGDELGQGVAVCGIPGRPPRARGREPSRTRRSINCRKTPACAGTSSPRDARTWTTPEEPLVRGDEVCPVDLRRRRAGRPPRARGRVLAADQAVDAVRKTPACAGTRTRALFDPTSPQEDPRVRGDEVIDPKLLQGKLGRPPRARGRDAEPRSQPPPTGKTPACAGTSGRPAGTVTVGGEDPRVRGNEALRPAVL